MKIVIARFYKFVSFPDYINWKNPLLEYCLNGGVKGTILLAYEGINGTIAGFPEVIEGIIEIFHSIPGFEDLEFKKTTVDFMPFKRMKVRLKKEIITIKAPNIDPNEKVGIYVKPKEWNQLISDPDVTLVDTRNDYEVAIGSFKGAKNPHTESFGEFPEYIEKNLNPNQHKKVALFCTGGIRCEKATSLMLKQGFEEVYHLEGGILQYLEEIPEEESLWEGECFVFDLRVAVKHRLEKGTYELCYASGNPVRKIQS